MNYAMRILLYVSGIFCLACGLLPLIYGILNMGTASFLLLGAALTALPRLWSGPLAWHPHIRRLIVILGCTGFVFCIVVSALMARRAWFNPPSEASSAAVIVLGGKIDGDRPSLMLQRRLDVAAGYLERSPEAICVVSGGQGADEIKPEAVVMRDYLVGLGIDPDRILVEDRSRNTKENLRYSSELIADDDSAVIVTDSFHQLRASVYAAAEGLETRNLSSLTPWGLMPSYWLREILGVSWAWLQLTIAN